MDTDVAGLPRLKWAGPRRRTVVGGRAADVFAKCVRHHDHERAMIWLRVIALLWMMPGAGRGLRRRRKAAAVRGDRLRRFPLVEARVPFGSDMVASVRCCRPATGVGPADAGEWAVPIIFAS